MRIIIVEDEIKIREGMGKLIESLTDILFWGRLPMGRKDLTWFSVLNRIL